MRRNPLSVLGFRVYPQQLVDNCVHEWFETPLKRASLRPLQAAGENFVILCFSN